MTGLRDIRQIVVHCSATKPTADIGKQEIDRWHRARSFRMIGYHFVIRRDGLVEEGRPISVAGAHVRGHNKYSIGICMVGGVDDDLEPSNNFTEDQWSALEKLVLNLREQFPATEILGHRDFPNVAKACPSFDVKEWFRSL